MTNNKLNNHELSHGHVGFTSDGFGQNKVAFGYVKDSSKAEADLVPVSSMLRDLRDVSPFAYRVGGVVELGGSLTGLAVSYPCVLFDRDKFGQPNYDPKVHDRQNKAWRMYVQRDSNKTIYFTESDDGETWDDPTLLSTTPFPASPAHALEGLQVFYNEDGIVTVSSVAYPFAAVYRIANVTAGDNTDLVMAYSLDGITWTAAAMADHDVTGAMVGQVVTGGLGQGFAYLDAVDPDAGTYNAGRPRTFKNAPGQWWGILRENDAATPAGDTVWGSVLVGMNSSDAADWNEGGHFANWARGLINQVGERSFGQFTQCQLFHVVKYKDVYLALVQLIYQVAAGATQVKSGIGLAISKDGLIFEMCGPLYDAGLTHALNDITNVVDAVGMASTAYLLNQGTGTGAAIVAGSIVVDKTGMAFNGYVPRNNNRREFIRVYHTEQNAGKIVWGWI